MKSPHLNPIISSIELILNKASIWSVVLPLGVGLLIIRKLSTDSSLIVGIVALATIPQLLNEFTISQDVKNIIYNVYTPIEFLLVFYLFKNKLNNIRIRKVFMSLALVYLFITGVFVIFFSLSKSFISEWVCINNLIYTAWILLILIEQYQNEKAMMSTRIPFFWYTLGIFIYAPCTLLIFSLWAYLMNHPNSALHNLWLIHHIFNISMYILFTIGLLTEKRNNMLKQAGFKNL